MGYSEDEESKVGRLTEKQRQCMELVVLRQSSKQIARQLGISKPTVDQRIANARNILGASSRDEAALMYARHAHIYDRVICDPVGVPKPEKNWELTDQGGLPDGMMMLQEPAIPFSGVTEQSYVGRHPFLRGPSVDFNSAQRILIIVGLTVGILAIVLVGLAVAQSLSSIFTAP